MPGATTASAVFLEAEIAWKLVMIPHTVPNRPTNGADEPTVARNRSRRSSRSVSRSMVTSSTLSMRVCRPSGARAPVSKLRFHSRMAATKTDAIAVGVRPVSER